MTCPAYSRMFCCGTQQAVQNHKLTFGFALPNALMGANQKI